SLTRLASIDRSCPEAAAHGAPTIGSSAERRIYLDVEDRPQKVLVAAGQKENDLDIVAPGIAMTTRAEHRGISQRRCAEAAPARLPFAQPLFRFLLQFLQFGRQVRVLGGVDRQRPGRSAQR